jgi:BirA family biotin operon repressor/biotin-[acetyl-CoA-carboxylase] ligase
MTQTFQPLILQYDSLPSTNTEAARQAAQGAPEGLCIVAREQTAGRGRQQRVWASPADAGLYFSILLRPRIHMHAWPLLTLMAAIAVADALRDAYALDVDIKWPNDIQARGRKLCGILAEAIESASGRACVVGIGINLTEQAFPQELRETAIAVETLTGERRPAREPLLRSLVAALAARYEQLQAAGGDAWVVREWTARSSYAEGKRVRVALEAEMIECTTRGLETDGALRVETPRGEIRIVRAGDVTSLREK